MGKSGSNTQTGTPENRLRHSLRPLRPLLWWLILVVCLFAWHTHERLLAKTRLWFTVTLSGRPVDREARATFANVRLVNGQCVPLGKHTLIITHPKAKPYTTNLFIWYGGRNLGTIELERAMGTLALSVTPAAPRLVVRGPDFSVTLTNSAGLTSSVPTDEYLILARYARVEERRKALVSSGETTVQSIAPRLGAARLSSSHPDTQFRLLTADGATTAAGTLPALVSDLPAGEYRLMAEYHRNAQEAKVKITAGTTNETMVMFVFGAARLDSQPAGATVVSGDGHEWGETPLSLPELRPGRWAFTLRLNGYLPVPLTLDIVPDQTNGFQTNLVKRSFAAALEQGRRAIAVANYQAAIAALNEALKEAPGNSEAEGLLRQAREGDALRKAQSQARRGDYQGALQQVQAALAIAPEDETAKQLAATYTKASEEAQAKADRARREQADAQRVRHIHEYFQQRMRTTINSQLFDQQEVKVKGSLTDVEAKLLVALTNQEPVFKLVSLLQPDTQTFFLQAKQSLKLGGWRRCDLVGGKTADGEVTLVFKVFEYAYAQELPLLSMAFGGTPDRDMVPIQASRLPPNKRSLLKRREEGIALVRERIRKATGE